VEALSHPRRVLTLLLSTPSALGFSTASGGRVSTSAGVSISGWSRKTFDSATSENSSYVCQSYKESKDISDGRVG